MPARVERLLRAYLAHRADASESFAGFTRRHDPADLRRMAEEALA